MKTCFEAGFAEVNINPPPGTRKIGWLCELFGNKLIDPPLMARLAVFKHGKATAAFLQLDVLSIRWSWVQRLRKTVTERFGFNGENLMVAATHNHAGPAVATAGEVARDDAYTDDLLERCALLIGQTLDNLQPAFSGFGNTHVWDVAFNRRVVMRDGTVQTHGTFQSPDALYIEGPIDPELAVLAVRAQNDGALLGCILNFACHPTEHGGDDTFTAGFPGCMAEDMARRGSPVSLFLNGACGNLHTRNPASDGNGLNMHEAGASLAQAAWQVIESITCENQPVPETRSRTVTLPYRQASAAEQKGEIRGAQRFVDPAIYDRLMPDLMRRINARKQQPAEVQVIQLGQIAYVSIPAEYFVEHQLRIKTATYPLHSLVVSHANGMVGYVPTNKAFEGGGYETTLAPTSRLAPEAGDILADNAIAILGSNEL